MIARDWIHSMGMSSQDFKRVPVAVLAAVLALSAGGAIAVPPRPVAVTGTDGPFGPGLGAGVVFTVFQADEDTAGNPVMNNAGDMVFVGTIAGPGVTAANDTGLWVYRNGQLSLLAREGDQAVDAPVGTVYGRFGASDSVLHIPFNPNITDSGRVGFKVGLRGLGVDLLHDDTLYTEGGGQLHLAIREGVTGLPGYPGTIFGMADGLREEFWWGSYINMRDDGRYMIRSRVFPRTFQNNDWDVIVDDTSGTLETFYRGNMPLPGFPAAQFTTSGFPFLTGSGIYNHWERHANGAAIGFDQATWSNRNGSREIIYRDGDVLPGGRVALGTPMVQSINSSGMMTFSSTTMVFGEDSDLRSEGFFGVAVQLAAPGDPAPGTPAGAAFTFLDLATSMLADNGATVFHAVLFPGRGGVTPANDRGIWSNRSGLTVNLEVREGDVAPGTAGLVFTGFQALFLNADARLAFVATTNDGQQGIWLQDTPGSYSLIAKAFDFGNPWDVMGDGSNLQLVMTINMWGATFGNTTSDGRRIPYNDSGDVVFRLSFLDGSEGIYTTSPEQIPSCPVDLNGDGNIDVLDFFAFIAAFAAGDAAADFTGDGNIDVLDFFAFIAAFSAGCP